MLPIYTRDGKFARPPDVEVELTFVSSEAGGRRTPAFSGYTPQFYYREHDWAAVHEYPDIERATLRRE
jgi:translation elongation factor EF-Tu-like GTPase